MDTKKLNYLKQLHAMFTKLKEKWQVSWFQFALIFSTFAIGGSLCGFFARQLLSSSTIEKGTFYVLIYIFLVTLLWPICVLLVSIPFGQFLFFKRYLSRIWCKIAKKWVKYPKNMKKLAIFASGTGTNAAKIIEHFNKSNLAKVALVVCNKPGAGVLTIAEQHQIPTLLIEKERFNSAFSYLAELAANEIDFIVLAGFLWKMPSSIINAYPNAIINIHPALLPKYGGKGMYGSIVHEAVIAAGDAETGITIHYVNEQYDEGAIIFQATCAIEAGDNAATIATKVHVLEHAHFARVVEGLLVLDK